MFDGGTVQNRLRMQKSLGQWKILNFEKIFEIINSKNLQNLENQQNLKSKEIALKKKRERKISKNSKKIITLKNS